MSAKEMFEKLGYTFKNHCRYLKNYKNGKTIFITFDEKKKTIVKGKCGYANEPININDYRITMRELKAINKQCEEMGWK